jgi:putative DNA primase/helicase
VLQEFVANALVKGAVKLDVMLILKGSGANGKSVLLEVMGALAGKENVSSISLNDLTSDVVMRHGFEHKLLNTSSESESKWVTSVLKQLTSHEPVMVKELYHNPYEMEDYGYLMAAVNEMPRAEATDAFYRRLRILPFEATFSPEEADPEMATKLKGELAGILNWFLEGLPPLMKRKHLASSKVCDGEMQNYRGATDIVYSFVQECCEKADTWVTGKMLHDRFKYFCESNSLSYTLTPQRFYEKLKNLRVKRDNRHNQVHFQLGLI